MGSPAKSRGVATSSTLAVPHPQSISPSDPTATFLALTQDITALISISLEATASLVHDWFRSTLGLVGLARVAHVPSRVGGPASDKMGDGKGMAVVVVGASEGERALSLMTGVAFLASQPADLSATGQSLTLHLAKSGYTVFPLVPLPSQHSPPTSQALSTLLLTWSGTQKRLKARNPGHTGAVVPVITDPENPYSYSFPPRADDWSTPEGTPQSPSPSRFSHASETVRLYCRDNDLTLVAIVCASRGAVRAKPILSPGGTMRSLPHSPTQDPESPSFPEDLSTIYGESSSPGGLQLTLSQRHIREDIQPSRLSPSALASTDEQTLLSLYRSNVLDPLSVIKELSDLLAVGSGRVVFVNGSGGFAGHDGESGHDGDPETGGGLPSAMKMIGAARAEAARLLRAELGGVGIDVCEVVVGEYVSCNSLRPVFFTRTSLISRSDGIKTWFTVPSPPT